MYNSSIDYQIVMRKQGDPHMQKPVQESQHKQNKLNSCTINLTFS